MRTIWKLLAVIAFTVLVVGTAAYFIWFHDSRKYYEPEVIEPEVFYDINFDEDLLVGVWKEGDVYYRYDDDGTAVTWNAADDVTEEEGSDCIWELNHNVFTHFYRMEMGGLIPKKYNLKTLELDVMEYEDDYGVKHRFVKADEPLIQ